MGPKGAEDFAFSTSDEDDEEAAVPQIPELPGSAGEELPFPVAGFPEGEQEQAQPQEQPMSSIRKFFLTKTSAVPRPVTTSDPK